LRTFGKITVVTLSKELKIADFGAMTFERTAQDQLTRQMKTSLTKKIKIEYDLIESSRTSWHLFQYEGSLLNCGPNHQNTFDVIGI